MKSSANNNSADQSAHLKSLEPTTVFKISRLTGKVLCIWWWCRSVCSSTKSGVNNDGSDQPAHLHSLRLAFGMRTNVGPTRINYVGPRLNQRNPYTMSYVGPTLGQHVGPTEARWASLRWANVSFQRWAYGVNNRKSTLGQRCHAIWGTTFFYNNKHCTILFLKIVIITHKNLSTLLCV